MFLKTFQTEYCYKSSTIHNISRVSFSVFYFVFVFVTSVSQWGKTTIKKFFSDQSRIHPSKKAKDPSLLPFLITIRSLTISCTTNTKGGKDISLKCQLTKSHINKKPCQLFDFVYILCILSLSFHILLNIIVIRRLAYY